MYDFKQDDRDTFGELLSRTFRRKGSHRWDTCVFKKRDNEIYVVYRHSKGQVDPDGIKRNHKRTETVFRAQSLFALRQLDLPTGPDTDQLFDSLFWKNLPLSE
ncbi:hypothetical protein [Tatumella ptyseos]|uniref:hypothetical protein n=1 Tax=Tatumella ptyseos TaxID=82987 RepID=UPI0026F13F2B|nr:hypothetical protein [Tatumella ptyseos]WKX27197.1 hypothetical protein QJR74_03365 [Tatumella ptyseos]